MITQLLKKLFLTGIVCLLPAYLQISLVQAEETNNTADRIYGTVVETMDAGNYTYVQLNTGKEKLWVAGPVTAINVGTMVAASNHMPMTNFHSKTLNRDFELIYFAPRLITDQAEPQESAPDPHSAIQQTRREPVTGIKKADGGMTVAEILAEKQALNGKTIVVRGKVIKYTADVLNKNWIHIADGSSDLDLTVTTDADAGIGDVVLVSGVLTLDRDFGYGYIYEVIVENAKITVE